MRDRIPESYKGFGVVVALILIAGAVAFAALELTGALDEEDASPAEVFEGATSTVPEEDPLAFTTARTRDLEEGATLGFSHVLYELSPGGVIESARRTAAWRNLIDRAAEDHDVDPEMMEAIVFLESAGRPEVIAGTDPANASGLAQIVASTGTALLEMEIDLPRSQALTETINSKGAEAVAARERARKLAESRINPDLKPKKAAEIRRKRQRKIQMLQKQAREADAAVAQAIRDRRSADERFDPPQALDGMARYLAIAKERLGPDDLAVTSYHMGIGNLSNVIAAFTGDDESPARELVEQNELTYTELYFDTSPIRNRDAYKVLDDLLDDSPTYYWRVLASLEIMRVYREDRDELRRLVVLHGNKATAEEVFHPEDETRVFDDPGELEDGLDAGELVPIPPGRKLGFEVGPQLGELTRELGVDRRLYRALRPEALAALTYLAGKVQAVSGKRNQRLIVTSAVRDREYQGVLIGRNIQATREYSLHTTGYAFDILRSYKSDKQARAFQFALDRLSAEGIIDYAREPSAIHITVSDRAKALLED